ncbi:hypothetical protein SAMN05216576_107264 [Ectopseudomonas chengduensis]|uniref:Uncharacterized protein n=1 Tax=Ectopseudomonas chengduensis TaxID=489632 RepID=A0A1G6Q594_9GAMM|nr:hypothetical protein SAMN05216576_107264 [Pseudomonas chengduensis]
MLLLRNWIKHNQRKLHHDSLLESFTEAFKCQMSNFRMQNQVTINQMRPDSRKGYLSAGIERIYADN